MPEMRFRVRWPDGEEETCYSPSLVIKDFFVPGDSYPMADFLAKSRAALSIASDRVKLRYGFPCGRALGQLQQIENRARGFADDRTAHVAVVAFLEGDGRA